MTTLVTLPLCDETLSLAAIISFVGLFVDLSDIVEQCFEFREIFIFRKLLFWITQLYDFKLKSAKDIVRFLIANAGIPRELFQALLEA